MAYPVSWKSPFCLSRFRIIVSLNIRWKPTEFIPLLCSERLDHEKWISSRVWNGRTDRSRRARYTILFGLFSLTLLFRVDTLILFLSFENRTTFIHSYTFWFSDSLTQPRADARKLIRWEGPQSRWQGTRDQTATTTTAQSRGLLFEIGSPWSSIGHPSEKDSGRRYPPPLARDTPSLYRCIGQLSSR